MEKSGKGDSVKTAITLVTGRVNQNILQFLNRFEMVQPGQDSVLIAHWSRSNFKIFLFQVIFKNQFRTANK